MTIRVVIMPLNYGMCNYLTDSWLNSTASNDSATTWLVITIGGNGDRRSMSSPYILQISNSNEGDDESKYVCVLKFPGRRI